MRIRDLNREGPELKIFADFQGDIYVSIYDSNLCRDTCVRIGGCGSGHNIPPKIRKLLIELAREFEKYKNCTYEDEAFELFMKEV